ncbi:unnamed protein product [Ectocarpus sp. CCAP 1310/34]|nr:unnamed protein product [Ectocarpus sp. CCAP 1310/34]
MKDRNWSTSKILKGLGLVSAAVIGRRIPALQCVLRAGADPNTPDGQRNTNLFTTLLAAAPARLNLVDEQGLTPLETATSFGQHKAVTCLLSPGASDRQVFQETRSGSLQEAVAGHDTLLPLLLFGKGFEAVGGLDSIPDAMGCAVTKSRTRTLNLLLSVEGGEARGRSSCSSRPGQTKQRWISMEYCRGMSSGQPNRYSVLQRRGTQ